MVHWTCTVLSTVCSRSAGLIHSLDESAELEESLTVRGDSVSHNLRLFSLIKKHFARKIDLVDSTN